LPMKQNNTWVPHQSITTSKEELDGKGKLGKMVDMWKPSNGDRVGCGQETAPSKKARLR